MTHGVLKSHRSKMDLIYVIMKTMCSPGYYYNGFVATDALGKIPISRPCYWMLIIFLLQSVMVFLNTGFEIQLTHKCLRRTLRKDSNDSFNEVTWSF